MTAPSQMSLRRIPEALRLRVRIAHAAGWEALIDTHTNQALQFVCEFAPRLPVLEGIELFFRVTAMPEAMQEAVRSRTLTALDLESLPPLIPLPALSGWQRLRIDLVLEHRRHCRRYHEKTLELARMVGARAAEAVIATHVQNAVGFTHLLKGVMPVSAATDHYLREFSLPDSVAQMVRQRVQARVAGDELTAQYHDPPPPPAELVEPAPSRLDPSPGTAPAFPEPAARGL
ncbi:MAG TPA: hypothetical protein VFU46_06005 [Gemmatimonadales bacterium]|nr:hypothetical protein [Gemmatimonadales bacterium]